MSAAPTLRQAVEGMALSFDPGAAGGERAVLEFEAPAERPPRCHLVIAEGACRFAPGPAAAPGLRIRADGETWRRIGAGEVDFLSAAGAGAVAASGDLGLTLRLPRWFPPGAPEALRAASDRPPGPIRLPAMAWLAVAHLPWKAFLLGAALLGPRAGAAAGAALALLLAAYRQRLGGSTFLERGSALLLLALAALGPPAGWRAAALALALLGFLWGLGAARPLPLPGEYARWRWKPALAATALFRHPNARIALAWSVAFLAGALAIAARGRGLLGGGALAALQLLAFGGAALFTRAEERGARARRVDDIDRSLARLRLAGFALAALSAALAAALLAGW